MLAAEGLHGVEVFHRWHADLKVHRFVQIADRLSLMKTGGSASLVRAPDGKTE